uniref:SET domain-containing protein n=1 Tax=Caenorhabditis tropicalis TaxID=1561998 RepID=A0A1I7TEF2_9PELO
MNVQEQWEEAYGIAERMYKNNCPIKRVDMNPFEQIVCARYNTIFTYDPYRDEYDFINQELQFDQPVNPKLRTIAEVDLDELKNNTVNCQLESPSYINITPIYVVPPSTVLMYNNTQAPDDKLNEALASAAPSFTLNPTEAEITPGTVLIFKHKNGKCYRCIVISEVEEENVNVAECDRKYEVAFLDHCQIVPVKLKTLFMPVNGIEKYQCALHCVRFLGIASFRSGFVSYYNNEIKEFYSDRSLRKAGIYALLYKTDKKEKKLIIDFPSIHGNHQTNSEETIQQQGHRSLAARDPMKLTYDQLKERIILPLTYPDQEESDSNNNEEVKENTNHISTTDDELDLSDTDQCQIKVDPPIVMKKSDCPVGLSSIEEFLEKARDEDTSPKKCGASLNASFVSSIQPSTVQEPKNSLEQEDCGLLDDTRNDSISSLRSGTINQTASSNPTPQPTFEAIVRNDEEETTPKKSNPKFEGSSDGWGEDTPKKQEIVKPIEQNKMNVGDQFGIQKPLRKPSSTAILNSQDSIVIPRAQTGTVSPSSKSGPLTPIPQIEYESLLKAGKPVASLMSMNIITPDKFKSTGSSDSYQTPPSGEPNNNHTFGRLPPPAKKFSESSFFVPKSVPKNSDFEDEVFNTTNSCDTFQKIIPNTSQDDNISKELKNQLLINKAQDNFEDTDNDGWEIPAQTQSVKVQEETSNNGTVAPKVSSSGYAPEKNICEKAICSDNKQHDPVELKREEDQSCSVPDEFADIPENLKQIAELYIDSIREAVIQKNHSVYMIEVVSLEVLSQKMPMDLHKRFMRAKLAEAKALDQAFD